MFKASEEELKRLEECLQKDDFRKLLEDYTKEISDPKVKEETERYLAQAEMEAKGATILKPPPWFCVKARSKHTAKVFINVCTSE